MFFMNISKGFLNSEHKSGKFASTEKLEIELFGIVKW